MPQQDRWKAASPWRRTSGSSTRPPRENVRPDRVAQHRRLGQSGRVLREVPLQGPSGPPRGQAPDAELAGQGREQAETGRRSRREHRLPRQARGRARPRPPIRPALEAEPESRGRRSAKPQRAGPRRRRRVPFWRGARRPVRRNARRRRYPSSPWRTRPLPKPLIGPASSRTCARGAGSAATPTRTPGSIKIITVEPGGRPVPPVSRTPGRVLGRP